MTTPALVEHFFRHEYGRLVSMLSCRVGIDRIEDIEDAVQSALLVALEHWTMNGLPSDPSAWLFRVANNRLMGDLRTQTRRQRILNQSAAEIGSFDGDDSIPLVNRDDDLLRMLFVCCDDAMPVPSQLVFALKILCGFDVAEIALRLFTTEANVYKRLSRARNHLRTTRPDFEQLTKEQYSRGLPTVHQVLYLMFTEGYLSCNAEFAVRPELCEEAIRLATILAGHSTGNTPETCALLAQMHLHLARMAGRQHESGCLLLLEEQDRSLWDTGEIEQGLQWLGKSADGETFSRYHAEAGIAAEHCLAKSFQQTRWDRVAECYSLLERFSESPIHRLNRAVAVAEWRGPAAGLAVLDGFDPPAWLSGSYLWGAVLADLHHRAGDHQSAKPYRALALRLAPTDQVRELIERRMENRGAE